MKNILLFVLLSVVSTCGDQIQPSTPATFENAGGKIKVFVCSRGCYQYLLEHNGTYYFPDQLPEELKEDGKAVIFSGELQNESTMVKKPSPNDAPVDDFLAKNIKLSGIKAG